MKVERDSTHSFDADLACEIGVEKAILVGYFQFWICENEKHKRASHFREGEYWTYITGSELAAKYPYLKEKSIYRWLDQLKDSGWLKKGKFNEKVIDQRTWYGRGNKLKSWIAFSISHFEKSAQNAVLPISQNKNWISHFEKWYSQNENPNSQNEKCINKDTVINTVINTVVNNQKSEPNESIDDQDSNAPASPVASRVRDPFFYKSDSEKTNVKFSQWWPLYSYNVNENYCRRLWVDLTDEERLTIMEHTPPYVKATPDKQFRKVPLKYLEEKVFNDEIIDRHATNRQSAQQNALASNPFGQGADIPAATTTRTRSFGQRKPVGVG